MVIFHRYVSLPEGNPQKNSSEIYSDDLITGTGTARNQVASMVKKPRRRRQRFWTTHKLGKTLVFYMKNRQMGMLDISQISLHI